MPLIVLVQLQQIGHWNNDYEVKALTLSFEDVWVFISLLTQQHWTHSPFQSSKSELINHLVNLLVPALQVWGLASFSASYKCKFKIFGFQIVARTKQSTEPCHLELWKFVMVFFTLLWHFIDQMPDIFKNLFFFFFKDNAGGIANVKNKLNRGQTGCYSDPQAGASWLAS